MTPLALFNNIKLIDIAAFAAGNAPAPIFAKLVAKGCAANLNAFLLKLLGKSVAEFAGVFIRLKRTKIFSRAFAAIPPES